MPYTLLQLGSIFEWRLASQQIGNPRSPQGQLQQTQKNCNSARIAARTPLEPTSSPVNLPSPWCEKKSLKNRMLRSRGRRCAGQNTPATFRGALSTHCAGCGGEGARLRRALVKRSEKTPNPLPL